MQFGKAKHPFIVAAALAAVQMALPALAGTTSPEVTLSTSGSTALKNWFVKSTNTFTDVQPGTALSINGTTYPTTGASEWNTTFAYQLAPPTFDPNIIEGQIVDQAPAVRFEYHESGSVEGILEMANDQIAPVRYVTQNIDRNPSLGTSNGNAVWVNYNQLGGGKNNFTVAGGGTSGGYGLGDFYSGGQAFTLGGTAQASFNQAGTNLNGGQNAVQLAVSDALPVQVFASTAGGADPHAATPWAHSVSDPGYGTGNPNLTAGPLGASGSRQTYQSAAVLNMPASAINPRTGTAFGTGPWNTAGLGNLDSQLVAVTATLFVANPGTGLTQVNRTDSQWLQLQSRLPNGATFNMTTRDVNSGTRNVAALETEIDPTWATGLNDDGNGNDATGGLGQITIGSQLRYSNKTAGGNELRPTVQSARMAVGTLAINDANGSTFTNSANGIRALSYSNTDAGQAATYVAPSYASIINGTYTIFQNEQFVTLKAPDASYSSSNANIQGDDATGDVKTLIGNSINSVAAYDNTNKPASPAAGLQAQGYILPQLMQVRKDQNGGAIVTNDVVHGAAPGQAYNAALVADPALSNSNTGKLANADPNTVTSGASSSVYGGNSVAAGGPAGFNGPINITGGNYLFGNFNQNGVRDFDAAVVQAQTAQAALNGSAGTSAFTADGGSANNTKVTTSITALDSMAGQTGTAGTTSAGASKGDLIVMGDYNGDGKFDGKDLYDMAVGASLSDATNRPTETIVGGVPTFTTGHITLPSGQSFGQVIDSTVLNKNVALDYLQSTGSAAQKLQARAVLSGATVPAGATDLHTNDAITGLKQFTFDATGQNAFDKHDVNGDGVIDLNDAVLVDKFNGQDYTNLGNVMQAYQQAPVTGTTQTANLVLMKQSDSSTAIDASDLAEINTGLTGAGNTNWYGYALQKTGTGAINFARTGGTVNVYAGASFAISGGTVVVGKGNSGAVAGAIDPFTDSSAAVGTDISKSLAVSVSGGNLNYAARTGGTDSGIKLYRLGSLALSGAGLVSLDSAASSSDRTLLVAGQLSFGGSTDAWTGKLDLGKNDLIVHNGNAWQIANQIKEGLAGTAGIASSSVIGSSPKTALGYGTITGTFDGQAVTASDVVVKYTLSGDATLDGSVNFSDLLIVAQHYNGIGTVWQTGDFNYDGNTNFSDLLSLAQNYNRNLALTASQVSTLDAAGGASFAAAFAQAQAQVAIPEPAPLGLLGVGAMGLLARRRRARSN